MIWYENECCGCATENYPCLGSLCPLRNVKHIACDECGDETDVYYFEGRELCIHCIEELLDPVE